MAGETEKCRATCLGIRPWSRTSHITTWLAPAGRISTVVKGAVRPKSMFLGQYDLNYTCEIVYYARARGELHALRECFPLVTRDALRDDYRALVCAEHVRATCAELASAGPDCRHWCNLLEGTLDALASGRGNLLAHTLSFELEALRLAGLKPDFSGYDPGSEWSEFSLESGAFGGSGRKIRISAPTARCLLAIGDEKNTTALLDAARVIGVFYQFHLGRVSEARRTALMVVSKPKRQKNEHEDQ